MDVWLKSGFLIPCIRLMWLSRREGRGKLGLSSAQYLREHSRKTGSKVTGPREPGGAAHTGREVRRTLLLAPGERAGWESPGGRVVPGTPQRHEAGKPAKVADNSKSECSSRPGALISLHALPSLPRGPKAGPVVSKEEATRGTWSHHRHSS